MASAEADDVMVMVVIMKMQLLCGVVGEKNENADHPPHQNDEGARKPAWEL